MIHFVHDGLYVASSEDDATVMPLWDGAVLSIGTAPCVVPSSPTFPQLVLDPPPDDPLDHVIIHAAVAFIAAQLESGRDVVVTADAGVTFAAMFPLAYLIGHLGRTLPDAFISVANHVSFWLPPFPWLLSLVECYDLPFSEDEIFDEYLPVRMLAQVTRALHPIQDGIYLGSIQALVHADATLAAGIQAVLRVDNVPREQVQWPNTVELLDLPIPDARDVAPAILARGAGFIAGQVSAGHNVLVHCQQGVSRSVTMVMAYLIDYRGLTLAQAYRRVVFQRPIARPHPMLVWSLVQTYHLPYTLAEVWHPLFLNALEQQASRVR